MTFSSVRGETGGGGVGGGGGGGGEGVGLAYVMMYHCMPPCSTI